MHERRNLLVCLLLMGAVIWGIVVWLVAAAIPSLRDIPPSLTVHRAVSASLVVLLGAALFYALTIEDKLPDELGKRTAGLYFEAEGLCFAPLLRVVPHAGGQRAEISLYYQNRYSGDCEAVIHLRPEVPGSVFSHAGARDVHFAFMVEGGAYGVVHQPVAVHPARQGSPMRFLVAAVVRYPRGHGERQRSKRGAPCGSFEVDWVEAYRQSEHELGGEIELKSPAQVNLVLPENVAPTIRRGEYTIEVLALPET
jgi:hypothetical protein